jgi:hypothetical protein
VRGCGGSQGLHSALCTSRNACQRTYEHRMGKALSRDRLGLGQTKTKWEFPEIHDSNQSSNCTWVRVASRAVG